VIFGQAFEAFLQNRILTPLGMNGTCFYLPKSKVSRLAYVYSSGVDGTMVSQGSYVKGPRKSFSGGAGFFKYCHELLEIFTNDAKRKNVSREKNNL
tara:strand:+ start:356 stop:643 length:288 start_codon:yes stop_codon:yes gene_type:complete